MGDITQTWKEKLKNQISTKKKNINKTKVFLNFYVIGKRISLAL